MKKQLTGKLQTQALIFRLIRDKKEMTKQEIASTLNLSMPTVLHSVDAMMQQGLLSEAGTNASTGGRKAMKLSLNPLAGYAIGVDLALHHVEIVITNLLGEILYRKIVPTRFKDEPDWYYNFEEELSLLLTEHDINADQILGLGISFPGIVDEASGYLLKSHILQMENINLDRFKKILPFPLVFANDANCACVSEYTPERPTYLYVSLNESVGGAIMLDGKLFLGDTFQAGEIGHMLLHPKGKTCYCGKEGCADAYLSPLALLKENETLENFFYRVENGDLDTQVTWANYLDSLAIFTSNLRMILNMDIVIGGEIGNYMESYLPLLNRRTGKYDLFARDIDYISPCKTKQSCCAAGAALLAIDRYMNTLLQ